MPQKFHKQSHSVLFVCSANQCRSPMAELLFKDLVSIKGATNDWKIESAGCWALPGNPATDTAHLAMSEHKIDLSTHLSKPVSEDLLEQFELILCMESEHKLFIQGNFPFFFEKVFLLSEMVGEHEEIWDPVGMSLGAYQETTRKLIKFLHDGYLEINRLSIIRK